MNIQNFRTIQPGLLVSFVLVMYVHIIPWLLLKGGERAKIFSIRSRVFERSDQFLRRKEYA
jgi:hypothetical protein